MAQPEMIKLATFVYWCIAHGIGDLIIWPIGIVAVGFYIWLMEDSTP